MSVLPFRTGQQRRLDAALEDAAPALAELRATVASWLCSAEEPLFGATPCEQTRLRILLDRARWRSLLSDYGVDVRRPLPLPG